MASPDRAVTASSLGAWVVKASPGPAFVAEHVRTGFGALTTRCMRRSYRTDLVEAGQPVLLWISGRDPLTPAGIHAAGHTTGPVEDSSDGLVMPVELSAVAPPVLRVELVLDPLLARIEVLRMPAGSNPSYLTRSELAALAEQWPQLGGIVDG
ncbi:MAG TPA: hypothetical protein VNS81_11360 [Nocardioides sp.]|nr:hypothetical protein [Nocardioides sp.]